MSQYQDRYTAFIDILGFSALVKRSESDPELLGRIVSALEEVIGFGALGNAMDASEGHIAGALFQDMYRMSTFSDSILISTKINPIGLSLITTICGIICNRLLHQGIFTRGALSKGKLIHTNQIVVGDGLIKAYKLESCTAIYPRIVLDESLLPDFMQMESQGQTQTLRRQDFDGLWHLHILSHQMLDMNSKTASSNHESLNRDYMSLGRKEIEASLKNAPDLAIKAKVTWLARYFNEYAGGFGLPAIALE